MVVKPALNLLKTEVPGLDRILGGGLPEYSVNLIGGGPGSGKTILAHQIMFNLARSGLRTAYFAAIGESLIKMLRYQQCFDFFDAGMIGDRVHFIDLAEKFLPRAINEIIEVIFEHIRELKPDVVIVDSFRSILHDSEYIAGGAHAVQDSLNRLALLLAGWQSTSFLISAFSEDEAQNNSLFTIADGIVELIQDEQKSSMVRKMRIRKMRGMSQIGGHHAFRIGESGVTVYPRSLPVQLSEPPAPVGRLERISTGVDEFDSMLGGGLPAGYSMLLVGPSGSGKTILSSEFILEGARRGETCVLATFEPHLDKLHHGELARVVDRGDVRLLTLRTLDLSVDMAMHNLTSILEDSIPKRLVFDSLSAFELALAPEFRNDFREAMYRLITVLTAQGVTIVMTAELDDNYSELQFSPYNRAFVLDAIVMQRYIEYEGLLRTVMGVVKLRGSAHSHDLRLYHIEGDGVHIDPAPVKLPGILTGRTGLDFRSAQEQD